MLLAGTGGVVQRPPASRACRSAYGLGVADQGADGELKGDDGEETLQEYGRPADRE
jgi:hypothetical protein